MVRRVPGFAFQSDDGGNRGFGQARGNVLIDGQRVPAKSNGAEAALGRIAVIRVVRIEVLDGAQTDIAGLSGKVVNVVNEGKVRSMAPCVTNGAPAKTFRRALTN